MATVIYERHITLKKGTSLQRKPNGHAQFSNVKISSVFGSKPSFPLRDAVKVTPNKLSVFLWNTMATARSTYVQVSYLFVHNTSFPLRETFKVAEEKPSVFCGTPWPRPVQYNVEQAICPSLISFWSKQARISSISSRMLRAGAASAAEGASTAAAAAAVATAAAAAAATAAAAAAGAGAAAASSRSKQQLQHATATWHKWKCFREAFARPREAFARAMTSSQPATSCHLPAASQRPAGHLAGSSKQRQAGRSSQLMPHDLCVWLDQTQGWHDATEKKAAFRLHWRTIDHVNCSLSKALHHGHGPITNSLSLQIIIKKCVPPWPRAKDAPFSRVIRLRAPTQYQPPTLLLSQPLNSVLPSYIWTPIKEFPLKARSKGSLSREPCGPCAWLIRANVILLAIQMQVW